MNASTLLDFFNHLGKSPTEVGGSSGGGRFGRTSDGVAVKEEPLSEEDLRLLQKDRQKKDNHNMSNNSQILSTYVHTFILPTYNSH